MDYQGYQRYLSTSVGPLMRRLTTALMVSKPDDPLTFLLGQLEEGLPPRAPTTDSERADIVADGLDNEYIAMQLESREIELSLEALAREAAALGAPSSRPRTGPASARPSTSRPALAGTSCVGYEGYVLRTLDPILRDLTTMLFQAQPEGSAAVRAFAAAHLRAVQRECAGDPQRLKTAAVTRAGMRRKLASQEEFRDVLRARMHRVNIGAPESAEWSLHLQDHELDHRARLKAFYYKNNPANLSRVDEILEAYRGKEDLLFRQLERKYRMKGMRQFLLEHYLTEGALDEHDERHAEVIAEIRAALDGMTEAELDAAVTLVLEEEEGAEAAERSARRRRRRRRKTDRGKR
jgi:hypothetical protein